MRLFFKTVVSGDVDPDTFLLKKSWENDIQILEKNKGTKKKKLEVNDDDVLKEISNSVDEFSLNDKQLLQLANVGVLLEDVFGGPRDIEWGFYEVRNDCNVITSRMEF